MAGLLYEQKTFTLPASNKATERQWDFATLTPDEFKAKYEIDDQEYSRIQKEGF
jgi:hypothetical protein